MSEVRLIDADVLEEIVRDDIRLYDSDRTYNMFNQMKRDCLVELAERIERAPTVDAVPVEWINAKIESLESQGNMFASIAARMIKAMLNDYGADGERKDERN